MGLHGRERERARLAALVEQARAGRAGGLLVRGEPGVGKSALLADLVAGPAAAGLRILQTSGVEAEAPLAFAALHRLLRPVLGLLGGLPGPQGRAMRIAFGVEDGPVVEPFLVGVGTLSLLGQTADEAPVLCVVDDAHWLDPASLDALLFAARRLEADRVALVLTARDQTGPTFVPEGVEAMVLSGLDPPAVRGLLAEHAGTALADEVAERLGARTGGNPLALVELLPALTPDQRAGIVPLPAVLPVGAGVQRAFLDRVRGLGEAAQTLLLVAAADDTGTAATERRAAALLGLDPAAWDDAERSGLLAVGGDRLQIRHPVLRSALYQAANPAQRRRVHLALAEALSNVDPDRRTWHRAAAADGPDDELAAALDEVARRASRRGGQRAAAAAWERAAELTDDEQRRAERRYAAAGCAWASGETARAAALVADARSHAEDPLLRADLDRLRGRIEVNLGNAADAHRIFVEAASAVADADPARALEMAVAAAVLLGYGVDSGASLEPAAIRAHPRLDGSARTRCLLALLASMTAAAAGDWRTALTTLPVALDEARDVGDLDVLGNVGNAALFLGDDGAAARSYATMLSAARAAGAGMSVGYALHRLAFPQLLAGRWGDVRASAEEALALGRSVGQPTLTATPLAWLTLLAALQGRADYPSRLAELDEVATRPLGILADPVHDLTRWARGIRAASDGDPAGALHQLGQMRLPTLTRMAALDRIDAAVRAGDPEQATAWTDELASFAEQTRWAWALGAVDVGRALLAEPAGRPDLFERALAAYARASRPYETARTRLAYGELLRRSQHRVDARVHLRQALDTFADLEAQPLLNRATSELRASGETARRRDPSTALALTPMERTVARQVSRGLSNKDVAAQCWVSPRTVAFHLRNVFAKTGVSSRGELAQLDLG